MKRKELERRLVCHFGVAPDKMGGFQSRLRHFQRLGCPEGANTGTGTAADYSAAALAELCAALHLNLVGIKPERAVEMVRAQRAAILASVEQGRACSFHALGELQGATPVEIRFDVSRIANS